MPNMLSSGTGTVLIEGSRDPSGLFRFNIIWFLYLNGIRKLDDNHIHTNLFKTELIDGDYWEKLENVKASNTARNPHYPTIYTVKQRHCNIVSKVSFFIYHRSGPKFTVAESRVHETPNSRCSPCSESFEILGVRTVHSNTCCSVFDPG